MFANAQSSRFERSDIRGLATYGGIAFAALAALLFVLNTHLGIGILPDSTRYMLYGPEDYDAPLYSWLLSTVTLFTGNMSTSAWLVGLPLYCANAVLIWHILTKASGLRAAAVGTALLLLSPHFVGLHTVAMSEPLYLFGTFISVLFFMKFAETGWRGWLLACGVALGLTMLTRFTTVPLIATLCIIAIADASCTNRQRARNVMMMGGPPTLIFLGWVIAAKLTTGHATGRGFEFNGNMDIDRWQSGIKTLSAYLLPVQVPGEIRYALLLIVLVATGWLWQHMIRQGRSRLVMAGADLRFLVPVTTGLFTLLYFAFLILSVSVEANLYLNGRYWLPFYIGLVLTAVPLIDQLKAQKGWRHLLYAAAASVALVLSATHTARTTKLTDGNYRQGKGYADLAWHYSPIIRHVENLPPEAIIYSNGPDAINYLTDHPDRARFIPFLFQRRTNRDDPRNSYQRQLTSMGRMLNRGGYVVFLDRIAWRFYLPTEAQLKKSLKLVLVKQLPDGRIYRSFLYPPARTRRK